jgi:hypothetical protein
MRELVIFNHAMVPFTPKKKEMWDKVPIIQGINGHGVTCSIWSRFGCKSHFNA